MPSQTPNYYSILGVHQGASDSELRATYRRLVLMHHPDKNKGDEKTATEKFQQLSEAFETLIDPEKRQTVGSVNSIDMDNRVNMDNNVDRNNNIDKDNCVNMDNNVDRDNNVDKDNLCVQPHKKLTHLASQLLGPRSCEDAPKA
ncbi:DnaJ domain-containing protein [Xylaria telfairii]|nr:DnaJ domain-containing protein [Xylaria telfairii]